MQTGRESEFFMRKILVISVLCGLSGGCAMLPGARPAPLTVPDIPVFFQPFSAALDQPALNTIATAAKFAGNYPDAPILVVGAADTVGGTKANELLSETRAQVVADQLVADGVAQSRITEKGLGETTTPGSALPTQFSRRALIRIGG